MPPSLAASLLSHRQIPMLLLLAASGTALTAAFGSQYLGGLAPCEMCWWQRWAYFAAIALLLPGLVRNNPARARRLVLVMASLALAIGGAVALFHTGVEQHWWQGFTACTSPVKATGGLDDLRAAILAAPVTRCDEIPWSLFGISIAGFNAMVSFALALFGFAAATRQEDE
ncbi:disulfide bond formation protein B [Niveispirillum irakense]|uniref:disulfide bond formation protein B n=1 Tax=Niveispirillum irakense TaxID=34011 RepID=UPI00048F7424|nr:disulfide bond formation protein B [Niveispirillum irakense]